MHTATLLIAAPAPAAPAQTRPAAIQTALTTHGRPADTILTFQRNLISIAVRSRHLNPELVVLDAALGQAVTDVLCDHFGAVPTIVTNGTDGLGAALAIASRLDRQ